MRVTPFISRERPNVNYSIAGWSRLPRPTSLMSMFRATSKGDREALKGDMQVQWERATMQQGR